jgi:hypothetical protein
VASDKQAELTGQAVLDLRHIIAGQVIHELTSDVTNVDGTDLVDQDPGFPARDGDLRPKDTKDRRLGASQSRNRVFERVQLPDGAAERVQQFALTRLVHEADATILINDTTGSAALPSLAVDEFAEADPGGFVRENAALEIEPLPHPVLMHKAARWAHQASR